jgi:hypothetical protein
MQYGLGYEYSTFLRKEGIFINIKTKFTVVIFSDKGTKQAGEVHLDVA